MMETIYLVIGALVYDIFYKILTYKKRSDPTDKVLKIFCPKCKKHWITSATFGDCLSCGERLLEPYEQQPEKPKLVRIK